MKTAKSKPLPPARKAEPDALAALPDSMIDTTDMAEVQDWRGAQRGRFFRPVKQQLTLRLDADLIAWFKSHATDGHGYQTSINNALRAYITKQATKA